MHSQNSLPRFSFVPRWGRNHFAHNKMEARAREKIKNIPKGMRMLDRTELRERLLNRSFGEDVISLPDDETLIGDK